jgi:hypothetical protein
MLAAGLCALSVIHLIILGVLGELVVSTSDLTHVHLPEITKKEIHLRGLSE